MNIMKKFRLVFKTSTIIFLTNFRYPLFADFFAKKRAFFSAWSAFNFLYVYFILSIMTDIEYAAIFQFFAENKQYPPLSIVNFCGKSH